MTSTPPPPVPVPTVGIPRSFRGGRTGRGGVLLALALLSACGGAEEEPDPAVPRAPDTAPVRRAVPADYASIQEALDAARIGDTVVVAPGVWSGPVDMPAAPVILASTVLTGADSSVVAETVIDGGGGGWVVRLDTLAGHSRILGLTLRNGTDCIRADGSFDFEGGILTDCGDGIAFLGAGGGHVAHSRIFENRDDGVDMAGDHVILLEHNLIRDNGDDGVEIRFAAYDGPLKRTVIRDNVIRGNGGDGVRIIAHTGPSARALLLEGNRVTENRGAGIACREAGSAGDGVDPPGPGAVLEAEVVFVGNVLQENGAGLTCGYLSTARPSESGSPET